MNFLIYIMFFQGKEEEKVKKERKNSNIKYCILTRNKKFNSYINYISCHLMSRQRKYYQPGNEGHKHTQIIDHGP
jgi:hypothetical protein